MAPETVVIPLSPSISPIFIVGCPRSGTTLLRNLLRSHPNLSFPRESHFIPKMAAIHGDPVSEPDARRLVDAIIAHPRVLRWKCSFDRQSLYACRAYSEIVHRVFDTYAKQEGKVRWGDKTPHNVVHIPLLATLFPGSRILHIIRDGRDTAISWLRCPFGPENLYVAARQWRYMTRVGRRDGAKLPPDRYLELRYETLLSGLEATMRQVCDFIQEPYDPAVLYPTVFTDPSPKLRASVVGRNDVGLNLTQTGVVTTNLGKWKTSMTARERALFESVAGDLLAELGLETEGLAHPISAPIRWGYELHSAAMEFAVRVNAYPARELASALKERSLNTVARFKRRLAH